MYRLFALALVVACGRAAEEPPPVPNTNPMPVGGSGSGEQKITKMTYRGPNTAAGCSKAEQHGTFKWIADDYASAVACAKSKQVPIVLDLWAPWCHTCLSMQSTVFADAALAPYADKFVYVALDTDREVNALAVEKFPLAAWPTFYIISPDESVLARFVGAASTAQFTAFLETGARALSGDAAGADKHLLAAERHLQAKNFAAADKELTAALQAAPAAWARKPDALVSLINAKSKQKDFVGCLALAEKSLDETGNAASATDFTYQAMSCAKEREKEDAARVKKLRERVIARLVKLADDKTAPLSVDDRSDTLVALREAHEVVGKKDVAKATAEKQRALLDEAAGKAASPMAAMTFNWPRAEVYVYLGRPLELVPALEKSAKDLPNEYDPPARLGWIYAKAGKLDEAATWTDRALEKVYGPRKVRLLAQRAEIAAGAKDKATEKKVREQIVKTLEALPASQTTPDAIAKAKQALADLDKKP